MYFQKCNQFSNYKIINFTHFCQPNIKPQQTYGESQQESISVAYLLIWKILYTNQLERMLFNHEFIILIFIFRELILSTINNFSNFPKKCLSSFTLKLKNFSWKNSITTPQKKGPFKSVCWKKCWKKFPNFLVFY